uniref:Uncharacterized protein n=1 Tax=Arundo donax TaxID=35708 RepID=A0A0A8ZK70_ARUDO
MRWHSAAATPAPNPSDRSALPSSLASMNPSPSRSNTPNAAWASSTVASSSSNSAAASSNPTDDAPAAPITPSTTSMSIPDVAAVLAGACGDGGVAVAVAVAAAGRRAEEVEEE